MSAVATEAALPDNNDASNILPLQMAECWGTTISATNHIGHRQYRPQAMTISATHITDALASFHWLRAHQVQIGSHCIPSSSRHCTSVLIRPTAVRRRSAVETPRPALIDLQSSQRPPVATCHYRRSLICCCWPASLEQSTC